MKAYLRINHVLKTAVAIVWSLPLDYGGLASLVDLNDVCHIQVAPPRVHSRVEKLNGKTDEPTNQTDRVASYEAEEKPAKYIEKGTRATKHNPTEKRTGSGRLRGTFIDDVNSDGVASARYPFLRAFLPNV